MTKERYVQLLHDFLSGDPQRVRDANQELFSSVVQDAESYGILGADFALVDITSRGVTTKLRGGA